VEIVRGLCSCSDKWMPYTAKDVQLEFVMLNPYIRTNLTPSPNGTFSVQFKIPDVYGIYKFRVQYRRPGLTVLSLNDQVSVRPYRHNEYERFIGAAFPYYISALSIAVGFFVFAFVFLFSK
jgi:oligosaccharyltransferase complex subunit beta